MPSALLPALLAAIEPIAAYCARTPAPNRHADYCAELINTISEYAEVAEAAADAQAAAPDWEAITERVITALNFPAPAWPVILRARRLLDSPAMKTRAALSVAQRLYLATITSHHLGIPTAYDEPDSQD